MNLGGTIRLNPLGVCIVVGACILLLVYVMSGGDKHNETDLLATTVNLKSLLIAAVEVAEKGGSAVKSTRLEADLQIKSKGETKEGVVDPVTNADFKSHCIMYHTLLNAFPKLKVISEEHDKSCVASDTATLDAVGVKGVNDLPDVLVPISDITVWIDPLDATKEFTENLLQYVTTMVCVAVNGRPVIGVIHRPFGPVVSTSWAWNGYGVSPELRKAVIAKLDESSEMKVIVSRSHAGQVKNISEKAFGPNTHVITAAGAGYKVLEVAAGLAQVYLHTTAIKKWDVCAGEAVLLARGGGMTDLQGRLLDYSAKADAVNSGGLLASLLSTEDQATLRGKLALALSAPPA